MHGEKTTHYNRVHERQKRLKKVSDEAQRTKGSMGQNENKPIDKIDLVSHLKDVLDCYS